MLPMAPCISRRNGLTAEALLPIDRLGDHIKNKATKFRWNKFGSRDTIVDRAAYRLRASLPEIVYHWFLVAQEEAWMVHSEVCTNDAEGL